MSLNLLLTLSIAVGLAAVTVLLVVLSRQRAQWMVAVLSILFVLVFFWIYRSQSIALYSDVPFHLSLIDASARHGLFPNDPFFEGFPAPLHYSLLHVIGGWMASLGGSVQQAWIWLGVLYVMLAGVAGYRIGGMLHPSHGLSWPSAVVFVFYTAAKMRPGFSETAALLVLTGITFLPKREAPRKLVASCMLAGALFGASIAVRLFTGGVGVAVAVACFLADRAHVFMKRLLMTLILLGVALSFAFPWISNLRGMESEKSPVAALFSPQTVLLCYPADLGRSVDEIFNFVPFTWLKCFYGVMLIGSLVALRFWREWPGEGTRYLSRWGISLLILFLLPWRFMLLSVGLDPYLVSRMLPIVSRVLNLFPPALAVCVVVGVAIQIFNQGVLSRSGRRRSMLVAVTLGVFLTVCFIPVAVRARLMVEYGADVPPRFEFLHAGKPAFDEIRGKTVLSDAWTSYMIHPAFGFYCFTVPDGHSSGRVDVTARSAQLNLFFAGRLDVASATSFMRQRHIDYVIINKRLAEGREIPHFNREVVGYNDFNSDFLLGLPLLRVVFEDEDVLLFKVQPLDPVRASDAAANGIE